MYLYYNVIIAEYFFIKYSGHSRTSLLCSHLWYGFALYATFTTRTAHVAEYNNVV